MGGTGDEVLVNKQHKAPTATITSASMLIGDNDDIKDNEDHDVYKDNLAPSVKSSSVKVVECESTKAKLDGRDENLDAFNVKSVSMEVVEADATSFSCDSDLLRSSFSAKSVTTEDGFLDLRKDDVLGSSNCEYLASQRHRK